MKYIIKCGFTDNSIKDLKYFKNQFHQKYNCVKNKNSLYTPLLSFNCNDCIKFDPQLIKKIQNLQTFRINISNIKLQNKVVYLLIEPLGFISSIQRLFEEYFLINSIKYNKINKWDHLYIKYINIDKLNVNIADLFFPPYIKVSSINIFKYNNKKSTLLDSISLKNI